MSFKSEAHRRKFQELLKQGKITQSVYDAFESETEGRLPERTPKNQKNVRVGKVKKARTI